MKSIIFVSLLLSLLLFVVYSYFVIFKSDEVTCPNLVRNCSKVQRLFSCGYFIFQGLLLFFIWGILSESISEFSTTFTWMSLVSSVFFAFSGVEVFYKFKKSRVTWTYYIALLFMLLWAFIVGYKTCYLFAVPILLMLVLYFTVSKFNRWQLNCEVIVRLFFYIQLGVLTLTSL